MDKTNGSITSEYLGGTKEKFLFTYSEEEKRQNEVNKNNAGLIFYADFYPRYNNLLRLDTTLEEDIILSFLYYWTKNGKYIYVKNEDLALLIKSSEKTASRVIQNLADKGYIDMKIKRIVGAGTDRKMKINVDIVRFLISNASSDHTEVILTSQTGQIDLSDGTNGPVIKEYIEKNNKNNISSKGECETKKTQTRESKKGKNTPSSTKEGTPPTPQQLLEAYENEKQLVQMIGNSKAVLERAEYKQDKKSRAYKTVSGFIQQLYGKVDTVRFGEVRGDTGTRFEYAVNKTKENEWKDIYRTEKEEREYQFYKKSLYLNKQENE